MIIFFTMCCALPLSTFYSFVGLYTGNAYVKFWKIAPIFTGISMIMWIIPITDAVDNLYLANLSINYTFMSLEAFIPWSNCDFANFTVDQCRNVNPLDVYTKLCCSGSTKPCNETFPFPALVYYQIFASVKHLAPRIVNYGIFLTCLILNVRRYIGFLTIITVIFSIIFIPVLYASIYFGQAYMMPNNFDVIPSNVFDVKLFFSQKPLNQTKLFRFYRP